MRPADLAAIALLVVLAGCSRAPDPAWSGYVEGEYVYVAAPLGGSLETLAVRRGEVVKQGAPLFALESASEQAAREEAAARLVGARAQASDAEKGRRPDELAVTQAQFAQARAEADVAAAEYERQRALLAQGFISRSRLDDARAAMEQSRQRVAEMTAALRVARLPAREDERLAAQASAQAAQQALRQSEWRTQQKQQRAPADATVADTYFRAGEWVPAGQPVVALLPPGQTKARFFVPEAELASLAIGQAVAIHCDGCGAPIPARIDFIATQAEYTPPVIYSNSQRSRLVFMVEARPDAKDGAKLKPGQPVDVRRAGETKS
ncbi:HlyD family efflux transporter periplasmic adaptor subunit [Piscinibacter sp. XHJ-5]|uniref:HlyD family secretion protein n=1 Tax=Piscinibacter sp. XHJ-5 TaxID=3037797 RepID=UPI002452F32A|nr:HlyD family efflux transporter periplasmic adaptor subunit [Piscinibacter sp. XHJ-5]